MGFFVDKSGKEIEVMGAHLKVRKLSKGELLEIRGETMKDMSIETDAGKNAKQTIRNFFSEKHDLFVVSKSIISWDLKDDSGRDIPVNMKTIGDLDSDFFDAVKVEIDKFYKPLTEEQSKN